MNTEVILSTFFEDLSAVAAKAKAALTPAAPAGVITDRLPRGKPSLPTLGPAGFTFNDPTFGAKILRVTDEKTGGGSTSWRTSSGTDRVWNAAGSHFFIENSGGGTRVFEFDAKAFTVQERDIKVPLVEPTWDQTSSLMVYGRDLGERPAVARVNILTGDRTIVFDVLEKIPAIASRGRTYLRGVTHAGGALAFICGGTSQDRDDYAVYLPANGAPKILNTIADSRLGIFCHAVAMDQSGRFVVLGATQGNINTGKARNYVWDTQFNTIAPITAFSAGHGAMGFGVAINASNVSDSQEYRWRSLAAPNTTRLVIADLPTPPQSNASSHLSWNHVQPDNQQPFVVASFRFGPGYAVTAANPWRPWDDEIIRVSLDGKTVERFCHHRSDVRPDNLPADDPHVGYWATCRPRTSPDGRFCLFTSNMEKTLGADPAGAGDLSAWRQDTFIVELK